MFAMIHVFVLYEMSFSYHPLVKLNGPIFLATEYISWTQATAFFTSNLWHYVAQKSLTQPERTSETLKQRGMATSSSPGDHLN